MLGRKLSHIPSEAMAGIQNYSEGRPGLLQHVLRPGEKFWHKLAQGECCAQSTNHSGHPLEITKLHPRNIAPITDGLA
jgi:hypothetical protein